MALGLTGDDHHVERAQVLDELSVGTAADLRSERGVVLGQQIVALDLEPGAGVARDRVEEERLFERGNERVADAAEHGVVRPDGQLVLPALG